MYDRMVMVVYMVIYPITVKYPQNIYDKTIYVTWSGCSHKYLYIWHKIIVFFNFAAVSSICKCVGSRSVVSFPTELTASSNSSWGFNRVYPKKLFYQITIVFFYIDIAMHKEQYTVTLHLKRLGIYVRSI